MPIVSVAGKFVYFAHVPKCAGSAIEDYLKERFGPLGFLDRAYLAIDEAERWTKSSPQHIPADALARLLPSTFFSAVFAVVRHPVDRLVSVFRHQRDVDGMVSAQLSFSDWLGGLEQKRRTDPFYLDNHPRPMIEIVPEDATVFRLEDGTEQVVDWLDIQADNRSGPRTISHGWDYTYHMTRLTREPGLPVAPTTADRIQVCKLYAEDFERFGYTPEGSP